jgi:hypothetical protein
MGMTDLGFLPMELLLALYFSGRTFGAPNWLQISTAVTMGFLSIWALIFGLHIWVPASIGHPLNQIINTAVLLIVLVAFVISYLTLRKREQLDGVTPRARPSFASSAILFTISTWMVAAIALLGAIGDCGNCLSAQGASLIAERIAIIGVVANAAGLFLIARAHAVKKSLV